MSPLTERTDVDNLPLSAKMILYHLRDTTLSAGPPRRTPRARFNLATPIAILLAVVAMLYVGARAMS